MRKLSFPTQKKILIVFLVLWALATPFGVTASLEKLSEIKYAPVESFYTICAIGVLLCLLPMIYALRRALPATNDPQLMVPVLAGMILPVFFAAIPHYANLKLADPQVYEINAPIAEKSRQLRTRRSGPAFLIYRLHFHFNDTKVGDKTLNGNHIVFVTEEIYNGLKAGDTYTLKIQTGPVAAYMLQTEETVNLGR